LLQFLDPIEAQRGAYGTQLKNTHGAALTARSKALCLCVLVRFYLSGVVQEIKRYDVADDLRQIVYNYTSVRLLGTLNNAATYLSTDKKIIVISAVECQCARNTLLEY
jgi:hypothetical protein